MICACFLLVVFIFSEFLYIYSTLIFCGSFFFLFPDSLLMFISWIQCETTVYWVHHLRWAALITDDVIILLTVFEILRLIFLSVLQGCVFILPFIIQPWFYPVVKYCFNAICSTRFIFVNSVIVSSNISCNDLSWDFIIMHVWYFVSWNSIFV